MWVEGIGTAAFSCGRASDGYQNHTGPVKWKDTVRARAREKKHFSPPAAFPRTTSSPVRCPNRAYSLVTGEGASPAATRGTESEKLASDAVARVCRTG